MERFTRMVVKSIIIVMLSALLVSCDNTGHNVRSQLSTPMWTNDPPYRLEGSSHEGISSSNDDFEMTVVKSLGRYAIPLQPMAAVVDINILEYDNMSGTDFGDDIHSVILINYAIEAEYYGYIIYPEEETEISINGSDFTVEGSIHDGSNPLSGLYKNREVRLGNVLFISTLSPDEITELSIKIPRVYDSNGNQVNTGNILEISE